VPCAVTGRALAAAALAYSLEKSDPLLVYRTFKARIRAAAQEKAQADPGSAQDERSDQQRSGLSVPSAPTSVAAVPKVRAASVSSPTKPRFYKGPAPTQKKASRKPHPTSRYASRGEHVIGDREPRRLFNYQPLFGPKVPAEYYPRRGNSGYYRERRWGDYYPDGGFDYN